MNIQSMLLETLVDAPWRFSEDRSLGVSQYEDPTNILENIIKSLQTDGQLAPIHVRPLPGSIAGYEIIDGHLVVTAARQLGLQYLDAVMHLDVDDAAARLMYIHFNLNRGGQYGQRHVKIMRQFKEAVKAGAAAKDLNNHVSWPLSRIEDYIAIDERGDSWRKFMFTTDDDGEGKQPSMFEPQERETPDF